MKNKPLFAWLAQLYAAELVNAAYHGILGRAPDEAGLKAYSAELARSPGKGGKSLPELLSAMSRSQEHWKELLQQRAEDLVRTTFQCLLQRAPEEHELKSYAEQLRDSRDLGGLLTAVGTSQAHWERTLERRAEELVLALYRGVFDRDPHPESLSRYSAELRASRDISGLLAAIGSSEELWHRQIANHAEELVRAAYRALLWREPDEGALSSYSTQLKEHQSIGELLQAIGKSQEHWRLLQRDRAEDVVRAAFAGLLDREPEPASLEAYVGQFRDGAGLAALLAEIGHSQEHWVRLLEEHAEELVGAIYRGLLGREPDSVGLAAYVSQFQDSKDLAEVVAGIGHSRERTRKLKEQQEWPHPALSYEARTWVFLHVQKTAGTSLQNMLVEAFGSSNVYREHADVLHLHSPAELSMYSLFAGHFNHDSLAFIPRRKLSIFTLVREPKQRLLSLYNFWRAHEPSAPGFHEPMKLANELDIETFYGCDEIAQRRDTWNHMTWCVMGDRRWKQWRLLLAGVAADQRKQAIDGFRPQIRERLRGFSFVGLQEDFAESCRLLFRILGRACPKPRADHSVAKLSATHAHIKRTTKPALTSRVDAAMSPLVEIDTILYEEAKALYEERREGPAARSQRNGRQQPLASRGGARRTSSRG